MATQYSGSCLCGEVRFEVVKFENRIAHCHCKMCQKFHGAAFSTFAEVKNENLHFTGGQNLLSSYQADNDTERKFCRNCGSSLLFISKYNRQDRTTEVSLSAFDNLPEQLNIDAHIFCASKAKWLSLNDDVNKFEQYRE